MFGDKVHKTAVINNIDSLNDLTFIDAAGLDVRTEDIDFTFSGGCLDLVHGGTSLDGGINAVFNQQDRSAFFCMAQAGIQRIIYKSRACCFAVDPGSESGMTGFID